MEKKGSMTVSMSILLLVILAIMAAALQSSRISSARVQAVNSIDTGLYSLFSEYDRDLLEIYNLFFLEGSYGTGKLNVSQIIDRTERYMQPVLSSGLTRCAVQTCAVDGLRLASDNKGQAIQQQIVRYMKENLGNAGIEAIKKSLSKNQTTIEQQEKVQEAGFEESQTDTAVPMEGISEMNNPLEIVKSIRENGFLGLVVPQGTEISEKTGGAGEMLSDRKAQTGFGEFPELQAKDSATDKLLIQEYALEKFSSFTERKEEGTLDYQAEYILGGKEKDRDNLSYVVNRLLLVREAANIAFLYTDSQKRAELEACASALSFLFLIPEGMTLVQAVLAAGWAYVESLSDVRILLSGGRVPLTKTTESWKTQLNHLTLDSTPSGKEGLNYKEYLRILFTFTSKEKITIRTMDMLEQNIRRIPGRESFTLDTCIDAASMSFQIMGPDNRIWQADRLYTYDM